MFSKLGLFWRNDDKGIVAVEFALLAIPFFIMLIGIIEVGLFFGSAVVLEGATADAARVVRTGQAQDSGNPLQVFQDALCGKARLMMDCTSIQYEVIKVSDGKFTTAATLTPTYDANGNMISSGFDVGDANDVILIRLGYKYKFLTPLIGQFMEFTGATNSAYLTSTAVIMNEPYRFGVQ